MPNCKGSQIHKRHFPKAQIHTEQHTIITVNFNTPLSSMDRSVKQRNNENYRDYKPNGFNKYLQDISPEHNGIYLLITHRTFPKST